MSRGLLIISATFMFACGNFFAAAARLLTTLERFKLFISNPFTPFASLLPLGITAFPGGKLSASLPRPAIGDLPPDGFAVVDGSPAAASCSTAEGMDLLMRIDTSLETLSESFLFVARLLSQQLRLCFTTGAGHPRIPGRPARLPASPI